MTTVHCDWGSFSYDHGKFCSVTLKRTQALLVCLHVSTLFPLTDVFMSYLNIVHSKIFIIRLNQENHTSTIFHDFSPINDIYIPIWMNFLSLLWFSASLLCHYKLYVAWHFPLTLSSCNALADERLSALVIGYLHKEQYESNSLTLFQLIAAGVVKPIVNADNSFHDY